MTADTSSAPPPRLDRPLTAQQLRFVQEVRRDGQATPAARRAGYSRKSARWTAHRLMRDPRIQALLAPPGGGGTGGPDEEEESGELWALAELRRMAAANILDLAVVRPDGALEVDMARLERDRAAGVREVTVLEKTAPDGTVTRLTRLKLADKSLALARLLRFGRLEDDAYNRGALQTRTLLLTMEPKRLAEMAARRKREMGLLG
ncbi:hypothetical protein GVN21_14605 [Caulobacter sp. SLTY]|uniref:terminase small subunit n=1 Tax=Caulobacter sp. SLTY TaxID=2683262 RepID=UPI001413515C|nr:terminase small subunit [Caulobacter sp. SLTY]NBB16591.1 hypothetical protein [Caulobacter sp. SLTY]